MSKLWGGRFQKVTNDAVDDFNSSIRFDKRFFEYDIKGSIAHTKMLAKQGIISVEDGEKIVGGLEDILKSSPEFDVSAEDIHMNVETLLIAKIGETGKKLHTARSRNDQVALDMRMYVKDEILILKGLLTELLDVLLKIIKEHTGTILSGYTHLQKAQPVTLSHHFMAYFEMFKRDIARLDDTYKRTNTMPLGSCALAGTVYNLDREFVARELGFTSPEGETPFVTLNSMDAVSDRDFCVELLSALSLIMMHLSRFSEEIILWASQEFGYIELDDAFCTGSSIMPQKKNPDVAELIRGKTGRVYGDLMALLTALKGLPLAYNKDMQEDKEAVFDALDTVKACVSIFSQMLESTVFKTDAMLKSARFGYTNATDVADYLVRKGIAFRDTHKIAGELVFYCIKHGKTLEELSLAEFKQFSDKFDEDIYTAIDLKTCVDARKTLGGPAREAMEKVIAIQERYLDGLKG
ncbi:argininosuccinate lyase [Candidatus Gastranaerophilus sp. (ex Termes propinquus)]|nr:argininosuccinate lyase [Candidatus Gastranaerophilus sp. (ex Termes propinquus)]